MPPRQSHKRAGSSGDPSSSKTKTSSSSSHAPKKTRFTEPGDDPASFAEDVEGALEDPTAKRKRVKTEGYDSDSSDDGEGVVYSRRKDQENKDGAQDDDDDMFAMGEKEDKKDEQNSAKKPEEKFLRLGDIEGQEFNDNDNSDAEVGEEDTASEGEPEDEDDAERRKKAGMGFELSSFNMREEMEEGKFSEDGTYIRTFDPHRVHDKWMDDVDEKEMKIARRRKRQREREQKLKEKAEEKELQEAGGKPAFEIQLLAKLKKGETVLEALQRLGAKAKKNKPSKSSKTKTDNPSADTEKATSDIDLITHLASNIMSLGDTEIYSKTYEQIVRSVRASGAVDDPDKWQPPSADVKYEYRWDIPDAPTDLFGPFSEEELLSWYKASYFGPTGEKVKVRPVGEEEWASWDRMFG